MTDDDSAAPLDQTPEEYEPSLLSRWVPIPKIFESVEHDGPFTRCLKCGSHLIDSGQQYVIEKVMRGSEPIIELAMCLNCRNDEGTRMSADSAKSIRSYFEERVDFGRRLIDLAVRGHDTDSLDAWLDHCLFSGAELDGMREYQVVALCQGDHVLRDFFPIMISGTAIEEISDLLSDETRGWMDDFIGDNFGMPSEFCDSPGFSPVLI